MGDPTPSTPPSDPQRDPQADAQAEAVAVTIPPFYMEPFGHPLAWRDEQSGALPEAVNALYAHVTVGEPLYPDQLAWVIGYLRYYLGAPCWKGRGAEDDATLARVRAQAGAAQTVEDVTALLQACLDDLAIDPL